MLLTFTAITRYAGWPGNPVSGLCAREAIVTVGAGVVGGTVLGWAVLGWAEGVGTCLPFIVKARPPATSPTAATRETAMTFVLPVHNHSGMFIGTVCLS